MDFLFRLPTDPSLFVFFTPLSHLQDRHFYWVKTSFKSVPGTLILFHSLFGDALSGLPTDQRTLFSYFTELVINLGNVLPKRENTHKILSLVTAAVPSKTLGTSQFAFLQGFC